MYPAAALVDDLYSYEDLPDAIDVGGIEYSKIDPPESVAGFTRYYINSNSEYLGILEGEGEDSTWTYEGGGGPCLINGFNGEGGEREDQFADTYTVTAGPYSATVSRIDICNWIGTDSCGNPVSLAYASGDPYTEPFKWFASIYFYNGGPCDDPGAAPLPGYKEGNQNTPIGEYQNGLTVS